MNVLRSFLFQALFYISTLVMMLVLLPVLPVIPRRWLWFVVSRIWVPWVLLLLRAVAGVRMQLTGREHIPDGPLLIAAKHQSAWETIALLPLFSDPAFILKRELMWIPVFGWFAAKLGMIPVDRDARFTALKSMSERAKAELAAGRQILIFPEGTRRPAGAPPAYKFGIAYLYAGFKVPCLPIGLNSGLFWPRRQALRPGLVRVEILPPIPPGLPRGTFMARLERDIETATQRLVLQGRIELGEVRPDTAATGTG